MNTSKLHQWKGYTWTLGELAGAYGIRYNVLYGRLHTMTLQDALKDLKWNGALPKKVNWKKCPICLRLYRGERALEVHHAKIHKGTTV